MPRISNQTISAIARRLREVPRPSRTAPGAHRPRPFLAAWFRVTGATQDGANKRWTYTARKLGPKSGAGYAGAWADDPNDTTEYTLYSINEKNNTSTGIYGNGLKQSDIDQANLAGANYAVAPIPANVPVLAIAVFLDDGTLEWWIPNLPNGVPGNCDGV